jgi:hypothetical protein
MKNLISIRLATLALLVIFTLVMVFHLFVIIGVIPFNMVWGGRLQTHEQMISFEVTSILLNFTMLAVVAVYAGYLKVKLNPGIIKVVLWIMVILFLLNTIGNLFSNNEWEKIIFTPITLLLAIFSLRLAIE